MKKLAIIGAFLAIGILLAGCQKTTQTNIDNAETGTISDQQANEVPNPPAPAEPTRPPQ